MRKLGKKTVMENVYLDGVLHGSFRTTKTVYEKKDGSFWAHFVRRYERVRPIVFRLGLFELRIDYKTIRQGQILQKENNHAGQTQKQTV